MHNHAGQIRKAGDQVAQKAHVIQTIAFVAAQYGGRAEVPDHLLAECCKLVFEKFGHFAADDIKEAYRAWASEQIKLDGAEMYGGQFNARQFGKVLAGYGEWRKKILAEVIKEHAKAKEHQTESERKNYLQQQFENQLPATIEDLRQNAESWQDVPEYIFHSLRKRGMLNLEATAAKSIFLEAVQIAQREETDRKNDIKARFQDAINIDDRAKVIARKLTVYRQVCKDPAWTYKIENQDV